MTVPQAVAGRQNISNTNTSYTVLWFDLVECMWCRMSIHYLASVM